MIRLYSILLLSIIWLGFSNQFTLLNTLFALIVSTIINFLFLKSSSITENTLRLSHLLYLIVFVIKELFISSLSLSKRILIPSAPTHPQFISLDISKLSHISKMVLANIISLTPGTLFIKFENNENNIVIHSMLEKEPKAVSDFIENELMPKIKKVFDKCI